MANPQSNTPPTTAIAKAMSSMPPHVQRLHAYLKPRMATLEMYAAKLVDPETLVKLACYEASRPESSWLEKSTPESVYASLIIAAQLGLEPGSVRGEGYLVPFKGKCSFMPGYRGFIKLAIQSGLVKTVRARPVFEGDDFAVMQGTEEWIRHVPAIGTGRTVERSPSVIAAYAVCNFKDGSQEFSVLDRWQLDKRRAASQNGPAWQQWPEEMFAKTAIRHGSKQWPLGGRFHAALKVDEAHDTGKPEAMREVIDLPDDAVSESTGAQVQVIERPSRIQEAAERLKPAAGWNWVGDGDDARCVNGGYSIKIEQTGAREFGWWLDKEGEEIAQGMGTSKGGALDAAQKAAK